MAAAGVKLLAGMMGARVGAGCKQGGVFGSKFAAGAVRAADLVKRMTLEEKAPAKW